MEENTRPLRLSSHAQAVAKSLLLRAPTGLLPSSAAAVCTVEYVEVVVHGVRTGASLSTTAEQCTRMKPPAMLRPVPPTWTNWIRADGEPVALTNLDHRGSHQVHQVRETWVHINSRAIIHRPPCAVLMWSPHPCHKAEHRHPPLDRGTGSVAQHLPALTDGVLAIHRRFQVGNHFC